MSNTLPEPPFEPEDAEYILVTGIGVSHYLSEPREILTVHANEEETMMLIRTDVAMRSMTTYAEVRQYLRELLAYRDGNGSLPRGCLAFSTITPKDLVRIATKALK